MGQILSDEGDQEEAINCLIDALRWDSKNGWALLMMGNIFAKFKDDIPTAMTYYDQALIANPNDNITMNNIGANLMNQGKNEEAKKYFWEAIKINDKYPNTHYALSLIAAEDNDLPSAFFSLVQSIKLSTSDDALHKSAVKMAFELAKTLTDSESGKKIFREYRHKLEFEGGKEIDIVVDAEIPTAAKIEFAENYAKPKHLVKYKPNYPAVEHLIMHELVHLDFVIEARKEDLNQLFVEGYYLVVNGGYLLVHHIPYVTPSKQINYGTLVCVLTYANPSRISPPVDHTIYFFGETPCNSDGVPLNSIINKIKLR